MSEILWKSAEGYVVVADQVQRPGEGSDLASIFDAGAWIVVWRSVDRLDWHVTRSRRYAKPSLSGLRAQDRAAWSDWVINEDGTAGWSKAELEDSVDPIALAAALYDAWQSTAAHALPAKMAYLAQRLPPEMTPPAWMRPGVDRLASWSVVIDEVLTDR